MRKWKNSGNNHAEEEKLQSILHPSSQAKEFKITLKFGFKTSPKYEKAVDLASQSVVLLTEDKLNSLNLKTGERARLLKIMEDGKRQAGAKRLESRIKSLQSRIKAKPQDVGLYYELYEIYRDLKDTKEAKKTVEKLVKKNPYEMEGHFLLAQLEYRERRYKDVLKSCRKILEAPDTARVERRLILGAAVYATIASDRLGKQKDMENYLRYLQQSVSPGELEAILQEEGLEQEWTKINSEKGKNGKISGKGENGEKSKLNIKKNW